MPVIRLRHSTKPDADAKSGFKIRLSSTKRPASSSLSPPTPHHPQQPSEVPSRPLRSLRGKRPARPPQQLINGMPLFHPPPAPPRGARGFALPETRPQPPGPEQDHVLPRVIRLRHDSKEVVHHLFPPVRSRRSTRQSVFSAPLPSSMPSTALPNKFKSQIFVNERLVEGEYVSCEFDRCTIALDRASNGKPRFRDCTFTDCRIVAGVFERCTITGIQAGALVDEAIGLGVQGHLIKCCELTLCDVRDMKVSECRLVDCDLLRCT